VSQTFSKISTKHFDVSFSSTFFVLSHFRVFFSDGSSKTLQKTFYKKDRVEKLLQKNRQKDTSPKLSKMLRIGLGANSPVLVPSTVY